MTTKTCSHFQLPLADPGPCMACERADMGGTPLVSFAGGKDTWHNGQTTTEYMRENKPLWEADGLTGDRSPVPVGTKSRWV